MPTYAHIETGRAIDVISTPDLATYRRILNAPNTWQVVTVPDGTVNGSTQNQQGGWDAPVIAAAVPEAIELSGTAFHTYCAGILAVVNNVTPQAGMARMGDIVLAMRTQGGLVAIAYERYQAAGNPGGKFSYADIPTLMGALQAAGIVTAQEAAGIVMGWPKQ